MLLSNNKETIVYLKGEIRITLVVNWANCDKQFCDYLGILSYIVIVFGFLAVAYWLSNLWVLSTTLFQVQQKKNEWRICNIKSSKNSPNISWIVLILWILTKFFISWFIFIYWKSFFFYPFQFLIFFNINLIIPEIIYIYIIIKYVS